MQPPRIIQLPPLQILQGDSSGESTNGGDANNAAMTRYICTEHASDNAGTNSRIDDDHDYCGVLRDHGQDSGERDYSMLMQHDNKGDGGGSAQNIAS